MAKSCVVERLAVVIDGQGAEDELVLAVLRESSGAEELTGVTG